MKKLILLVLLSLIPFCSALAAETTAQRASLSTKDRADLTRIEDYLNSLKNLSADFMQIDDAGGIMRGQLIIARPGKMRATYDSGDFIVADGTFVHIWNNDLRAQTNLDQDSSLAEFILRDPIDLHGDITVTKFERPPGLINVTLVETHDQGAGSLTLVFQNNPLQLRQWKVVDPQGHTTGVNLENVSDGGHFPSSTFAFIPPTFDKRHP